MTTRLPVNGLTVDLDLSGYATKEDLQTIGLTPGPKGDNGIDGKQGIQGEHGERGDVGPVGPHGERGEKGDAGVQGPVGEQGPPGQVITVDHEGKQGIEGPQGPKGDKGDKGDTGEAGPMGPQGVEGPQGARGTQGEHGADGVAGVSGQKGDKGDKGDAGPKGDKGDAGPAGKDGVATAGNTDCCADLQKQLDELKRRLDNTKIDNKEVDFVPERDEIPGNAFLHLDGSKYSGSGNWIDQTGRGLDAIMGANAPTYDAANKCFNFVAVSGGLDTPDTFATSSQWMYVDTQKILNSYPGMSTADFNARNDGQKSMVSQFSRAQPRTFLTWVKFKPYTFGRIYPGQRRYQYAIGYGDQVPNSAFSLGSNSDGTPVVYVGTEKGCDLTVNGVVSATTGLPDTRADRWTPMYAEGVGANQWVLMTATVTPTPGSTSGTAGSVSLYIDDGTKNWTWNNSSAQAIAINTSNQTGDSYFKIGKFQWKDVVSYPEATYTFSATNALIAGKRYKIMVKGDTNWTAIGAANNDVGTVFTKNSTAGSGTGRACEFKVKKLNDNGTGTETAANDNVGTPKIVSQYNGHEGMNGSIGMITMYNRVLTPTEIRQYYHSTKANYKGK
jgi:hypothetical protein